MCPNAMYYLCCYCDNICIYIIYILQSRMYDCGVYIYKCVQIHPTLQLQFFRFVDTFFVMTKLMRLESVKKTHLITPPFTMLYDANSLRRQTLSLTLTIKQHWTGKIKERPYSFHSLEKKKNDAVCLSKTILIIKNHHNAH